MRKRHVALLVEDEPEMATELGELLESIGHGHIHAATKEEAERLVEEGAFCYVLLDLQIKVNADSIKAHVEAGQSLLETIRSRYPRRNDHDKYRLPILVVSGHAKEHYYVVEAMKAGADDFITKPVSESKPPFREKIQEALRRSGRDGHDRCAAVMRLARAADPSEQGDEVAAPVVRASLRITGRQEGKRLEVLIGDKPVLLTCASFLILLRLVVGRHEEPEGWVHKRDLGAKDEQGWKGISRLRGELRPHLPGDVMPTDNDSHGSYRLNAAIEVTAVDAAALKNHTDHRVCELAQRARPCGSAKKRKGRTRRRS